jgi:Domain of unknown function (DUF4268)
MKIELGTLSKVDPRTVFSGEKAPLTTWLAAHLDTVGAALGMDLELIEQNGTSGGVSADIIARDIGRDRIVIIENSLDATDDSHLGKIITCASGQDARVIVWVSFEFRDSHRQALDWLNRRGSAAEFYALGFDLFKIDDSKPGIDLRLEAAPNGHAAATVVSSKGSSGSTNDNEPPAGTGSTHNGGSNRAANGNRVAQTTNGSANGHAKPDADAGTNGNGYASATVARDHQETYRKFFQRLVDELREKHRFTNAKLGQPQNWYSFASGTSGLVYSIWFSTGGRVRAELYIDVGNRELNRSIFDRLRQHASETEKEFGGKLEWDATESRRACSIGTYVPGKIDDPPEALETILKWAIDRLVRLKTVFGPRLPGVVRSLQQAEAR